MSFSPQTKTLVREHCTPAQVEALELRHEQGLGYEAIGLVLGGISKQAARDRVKAAERKLEAVMGAQAKRAELYVSIRTAILDALDETPGPMKLAAEAAADSVLAILEEAA